MAKIKYTADGKKVSLIGSINSSQLVVQEIFIKEDGSEIPGGENFIVTKVFDEPVKSWKESKLEKLEREYDERKKEAYAKIDELKKQHRKEADTIKKKIEYLRKVKPEAVKEAVDRIIKFIGGEYTHVVQESYSDISIRRLDDILLTSFSNIKLVSLFGADDGTLSYKLNTYSDGGGGDTNIFLCESYLEAKELFKKQVEERSLVSDRTLAEAKKHGISVSDRLIQATKEAKIKTLTENLESRLKELKKAQEQLEAAQADS